MPVERVGRAMLGVGKKQADAFGGAVFGGQMGEGFSVAVEFWQIGEFVKGFSQELRFVFGAGGDSFVGKFHGGQEAVRIAEILAQQSALGK